MNLKKKHQGMKNAENSRRYTYKITLISVNNCPRVANLIYQSNATTWYSYLMGRYENKFI